MALSDQHILIDDLVLHNIVEYADLHHRDVVLEIGAGTGVLTEELRKRVMKVFAIESDATFAELLNRRFEDTNVEVIHGDEFIGSMSVLAEGDLRMDESVLEDGNGKM